MQLSPDLHPQDESECVEIEKLREMVEEMSKDSMKKEKAMDQLIQDALALRSTLDAENGEPQRHNNEVKNISHLPSTTGVNELNVTTNPIVLEKDETVMKTTQHVPANVNPKDEQDNEQHQSVTDQKHPEPKSMKNTFEEETAQRDNSDEMDRDFNEWQFQEKYQERMTGIDWTKLKGRMSVLPHHMKGQNQRRIEAIINRYLEIKRLKASLENRKRKRQVMEHAVRDQMEQPEDVEFVETEVKTQKKKSGVTLSKSSAPNKSLKTDQSNPKQKAIFKSARILRPLQERISAVRQRKSEILERLSMEHPRARSSIDHLMIEKRVWDHDRADPDINRTSAIVHPAKEHQKSIQNHAVFVFEETAQRSPLYGEQDEYVSINGLLRDHETLASNMDWKTLLEVDTISDPDDCEDCQCVELSPVEISNIRQKDEDAFMRNLRATRGLIHEIQYSERRHPGADFHDFSFPSRSNEMHVSDRNGFRRLGTKKAVQKVSFGTTAPRAKQRVTHQHTLQNQILRMQQPKDVESMKTEEKTQKKKSVLKLSKSSAPNKSLKTDQSNPKQKAIFKSEEVKQFESLLKDVEIQTEVIRKQRLKSQDYRLKSILDTDKKGKQPESVPLQVKDNQLLEEKRMIRPMHRMQMRGEHISINLPVKSIQRVLIPLIFAAAVIDCIIHWNTWCPSWSFGVESYHRTESTDSMTAIEPQFRWWRSTIEANGTGGRNAWEYATDEWDRWKSSRRVPRRVARGARGNTLCEMPLHLMLGISATIAAACFIGYLF